MTDGAPATHAVGDVARLWLEAQHHVAGRAAHELKNALNGVAVNLAVVQSRLRRQQAPESLTRFADAAVAQLDLLTEQVEALLALCRSGSATSDVGLLVRQIAALVGPTSGEGRGFAITAPDPGVARTNADPVAVRALVATLVVGAAEPGAKGDCIVTVGDDGRVRMAVSSDASPGLDDALATLARAAGVGTAQPSATELVLTFPPAGDSPTA